MAAEVAIGMSGDRVIGDTSRISRLMMNRQRIVRTYTASDAAGELPDSREASNVSVGGVEYALHSAIKRTTSRAICSFYFYFAP